MGNRIHLILRKIFLSKSLVRMSRWLGERVSFVCMQEARVLGCSCPGWLGRAHRHDASKLWVSDSLKIHRLRTEMEGKHKPNPAFVNPWVLVTIKPNMNLVLKWYLVMESKFLLLPIVIKQALVLKAHKLFFLRFFLMWTIFKVSVQFITILILLFMFCFFLSWSWGMLDLVTRPGIELMPPRLEGKVLTTGEPGKFQEHPNL